jgi:hypothetical protein
MDKNIKEFRKTNVENLDASQELFEKQLSFVSAGALGVSMFLIEKVVKNLNAAHYKWMIISCWTLLGFTLILNLISHYLAVKFNYSNIEEIDDKNYDYKKATRRNKTLKTLNLITLITLVTGIFSLILFISLNI